MKLRISKALRIISSIWALMGLLCLGLAVTAVVQNRYEDPLTFFAAAFCVFVALILFLVSFIKTTHSISRSPFVITILWVVVVLFGLWTLLGLGNVLAAFF